MKSRERVLLALNHQEPDRVPIDFGSTISTTIVASAYENLKKHLGLDHETKIRTVRARTVIPDDSILERFDIDTRALVLGNFTDGFKKIEENTMVDGWGTTWRRGDDGHYINVDGPFKNADLSIDALETHQWPDPEDPGLYRGLKERAEFLRKTTDCALVLGLPLGIVHQCQFMRGFAEWLMDLYVNPECASRMMEIISNIWIRIAENALDAVGPNVDIVEWGDDIGMQEGPLMNPEIYRKLVKPHHKKMVHAVKMRSDVKIHYHTCGAVSPLIEDIIEIGADALNPVQVSAKGMDPGELKNSFGDRISFWGGIDTHHILPGESPERVREEVRRIVELLGKGGGYILASVHNIQPDVPPQNIVAMFEAAKTARWR